jgi:hypothetical protein
MADGDALGWQAHMRRLSSCSTTDAGGDAAEVDGAICSTQVLGQQGCHRCLQLLLLLLNLDGDVQAAGVFEAQICQQCCLLL